MIVKFCYMLAKIFFWTFFKIYNRVSAKWEAPLPESDRYIVAANHCSHLDPMLIGAHFPKQLKYLAKDELFHIFFFSWIIRTLGAVPVLQNDSNAAAAALKSFLHLLQEGESVILFPEGGRSLDGKLKPLEGGAALISIKSGVPIIPVYATGAYEAMPVGAILIKPAKIRLYFGEAIYPPETKEKSSKKAREELTQALSKALNDMENKYGK